MTKDIYVVQKTAEEGKQLEDWCIENYIPISSSRFGFDESWKLFAWYQTLQDGFLANQSIKINKQDLTQVTIEEFKRLQLESLGKTEELFILPDEGCFYGTKEQRITFAKFLCTRPFCRADDKISKDEAIGVGWNKTSHWWLKTNKSEKTEYNFQQLKPFIKNVEEISYDFKPGDWVKTKSYKTNPFELQEDNFPIKNDLLAGFKLQDLVKCEKPNSTTSPKKLSEFKYPDVIHIETQEEYNKVKSIVGSDYDSKYNYYLVKYAGVAENRAVYENQEYTIYEMNQIIFEETEYKVGDVVIATGNINGYKRLKGRIKEINLDNSKRHQYRIDYKEFNSNKCDLIWSDVHELVDEKQNESLVGRWVKRISYLTYPAFWVQIGQYDLIEADNDSNWLLKTFRNCAKEYLLKDFELMPKGFNPNEVVKPSLDFSQLNLEDWLRETKKLNLSEEQLEKQIRLGPTCNFDMVYLQLKGLDSDEKAEILWNEWNKPEIDKTDFIVSIPDEWGQNKYVIGIDPYKLLEEEFKPNTQATLIPVKQKQIFKN